MKDEIKNKYDLWCQKAVIDKDIVKELSKMKEDQKMMEDSFYKNLEFGTGGLRGVIGAGSNRMNVYTVAKASQGLADYVNKNNKKETLSIAVGYDSRNKSNLFAETAATVFAANGIHVYIYPTLMPTPCLSYAVRSLGCSAGIMITASHNPAKYNGYKVYGEDGCQITTEAADLILAEIEKLDIFSDVKVCDFKQELENGNISYIDEQIYTDFVEEVKQQSLLGPMDQVDKNVAIVYTPLNGTGLKPVTRTLKEAGFTNITIVKEQELPDGNFPTCPYPNPEIKEAMFLGMEYAKKYDANLLLATDPDCDRVGIAVANAEGEYVLLSGNQTGCLLLNYICERKIQNGTMPKNPVLVKTIVTTDLGRKIAEHYGVKTIDVLTGFKFIGEQIGLLEQEGKERDYIFGFEESYGYLSGSYVRDKDAVDASLLICEMFAYYKAQKITLLDKLNEIYDTYGYCLNTLYSYEFEGVEGFDKMQNIMEAFRQNKNQIGGMDIVNVKDYADGIDGLPKSNVLKFFLQDDCSVVVRPSGTEPKIKLYLSVNAKNEELAKITEDKLMNSLSLFLK